MPRATGETAPLERRELLRDVEVAQLLGVGRSTVLKWRKSRLIPEPVAVGGATRWRLAELRAWVEAGCPAQGERREGREWRWQPSIVCSLEVYYRTLRAESSRLAEEAGRVAELIAKGEKLVHMRRAQ
jgi:excisionase family DNA binding protein